MKNSLPYFIKGFSLANNSLDLMIIGILLSLSSVAADYLPPSVLTLILSIFSFLLAFVSVGYLMSLPLFLLRKQERITLNPKELVSVVFRNTKRLIIPLGLLFVIFIVGFGVSLIALGSIFHWNVDQLNNFVQSLWNGHSLSLTFLLSGLLLTVVSGLLQFTAFFFSLENKSFIESIKLSFVLSSKNLNYITFVILVDFVSYILLSQLPLNLLSTVIINIIQTYISVLLVSSTLFYYQSLHTKIS